MVDRPHMTLLLTSELLSNRFYGNEKNGFGHSGSKSYAVLTVPGLIAILSGAECQWA